MWIKSKKVLEMAKENTRLSGEAGYYKARYETKSEALQSLRAEYDALSQKTSRLESENYSLASENAKLKEEIAALKAAATQTEIETDDESDENKDKDTDMGKIYDELMNGVPDKTTGKVVWTDGRD